MPEHSARPARTLSIADASLVVIGIVIGAGIFKTPALVAANSSSDAVMLLLWLAGGLIALIGALCYAELASTYPSTGGDYRFLMRAFGRGPAFLFAWSRLAVLQTGSIVILAFVFGDYATQLLPLGPHSASIYAASAVILFTGINLLGIHEGKQTQRFFTTIEILGLIAIAALCLALAGPDGAAAAASTNPAESAPSPMASLGLAMVFVLLTYGGWNEGAYVSAEVRGNKVPIVTTLLLSIAVITTLYLLVNLGFLWALGREGMAASEAIAADAMGAVLGPKAVNFVSALVAVSALTSINATIITGARCNHALGRDFAMFRYLGRWNARGSTPRNALLAQGAIALLLVWLGTATRSGFSTLVEYTAPVFWLFFLLTGLSLFRLRRRDPHAVRPYKVPLYPLTPIAFCASSAYMLWSSLNYTGIGALVGVAVMLLGLPLLWLMQRQDTAASISEGDHREREDRITRVSG